MRSDASDTSPENATRPAIQDDAQVDALATLAVDDSLPSIVVLAGRGEQDHAALVSAVVERLEAWEQPAQRATLSLEGLEGDRLADYLAYQASWRSPELSDEQRAERVEALLDITREHMVPVFNTITLAMFLSLALDADDPSVRLRNLLDLPPIPFESVPLIDPILVDHALRTLAEERHTVVHLDDVLRLPTALTGTEVGILSWLALASERHPKITLVLSVDPDIATETVVPYSRGGVHRVELEASVEHPSEEGAKTLAALRTRLDAVDAERPALDDFLFDAALCGPVVPVVPLLDALGLDDASREAVEDALDDFLVVGETEHEAPFLDFEFRHPGFPPGALDGGGSTYVYRFRSSTLRRALLVGRSAGERRERALALNASFEGRLPTTTRSIARLRAHLAEHLEDAQRRRALQRLAWWIQPRETPFLRAVLERDLRAGALEAREIWRAARSEENQPPLWRLALVEACVAEGERFLEDFTEEERQTLRTRLAELRKEVMAQRG